MIRLGLEVGDIVKIGAQDFKIKGVITHESDRISTRGFVMAPRAMISTIMLDSTGIVQHGSQARFDHRIMAPHARTPEDFERIQSSIVNAFPDAKWRGRNAFNAAPRVERWIDRLTQFLTLTGLAALLVGGVGISNAVRSFLDSKRANVATLKCLGASGKFVIRVYMLMILLLTVLGVAGGLVLGAGVAMAGGVLVTEKLSLVNRIGVYPGALILSAAFGFLSSLCFSLWPVVRGARVPPNDLFRDAVIAMKTRIDFNTVLYIFICAQMLALLSIWIAHDKMLAVIFALAAAAAFAIFSLYAGTVKKLLSQLKLSIKPEWRMALANIHRPGNVTTGIVLSLGLGLTVLIAVALVEDSFSRVLQREVTPNTPSFFFLDIQHTQAEEFRAIVESMPSARELIMTPTFKGRITAANGIPAEEALVDRDERWVARSDRNFTWLRAQPSVGDIVEGTWWPEDYNGPPLVSIATNVARAFDIGAGDNITVNVYGIDVTAKIANVRDINWSSLTMNFAVTFAPGGPLEKAPANMLATVIVDEKDEEPLQTQLVKDLPGVTTIRVREALSSAQGMVSSIALAIKTSAAITLLVGVLVLGGGIAAARRRHVYDAVVLKVLGAEKSRILKTFLYEYAVLGLMTAVIAAALGLIAARGIITGIMNFEWSFRWSVLLGATGLSLGITLLGGFFGTFRALLQKPAQHLRNQ